MNSYSNITAEALAGFNRKLAEQTVSALSGDGKFGSSEFLESLVAGIAQDAGRWLAIQNGFYRQHLELWARFAGVQDISNAPAPSVVELDRRFRGKEWLEPYFNYLAQSYLLTARWVSDIVANAKAEPHIKRKMTFFAQQLVDAMSPANFLWSNPEALRLAAETRGDSLRRGLKNLS